MLVKLCRRFACGLLLLSIFINGVSVSAGSELKKCTWVGDSRTVMCKPSKAWGGVFAQVSGNAHTFEGIIRGKCYDNGNDKIWRGKLKMYIVSWFGINDTGNWSKYKKMYNKMLKKGHRIILISVPGAKSFNKRLKAYADSNKNVEYITVKYDRNNMYKDGVHFKEFECKKIRKRIERKVKEVIKDGF